MTDSLTTKVASSPDTEISDIESTVASPGNTNRAPDIIERTEVIRRAPTIVKKVFTIEDDSEEDDDEETRQDCLSHMLRSTLEDELYESRLLNLPGLIEHLFPNDLLPIPFESLRLFAKSRLWDKAKEQWNDHHPASSTFFNSLGNALVDAAYTLPYYTPFASRFWSNECHLPPYGAADNSAYKRISGINLVDRNRPSATWSTIVVNAERRDSASEAGNALRALTEGALMIFHHQPERRFLISLSICGNEFRVYVFDRAGLVGSEPFHLKKDSDSLIRLMAGLVLTDNSSLGFDASISVAVTRAGKFSRTAVAGGQHYLLVKTLQVSYDLTGRGSVIWHARRGKVDYVIKDTWVDATSTRNEADLLLKVQGVEGITQLVSNENIMLRVEGRVDDTAHLRRFIGGVKDFKHKERYDALPVRIHNRIVTTPFAQPLNTFKSKKELLTVLIDAIETHRRLVEKKIMHSDISSGNVLILRPSLEENGNPFADPVAPPDSSPPKETPPPRAKGLLIDLDSAVITHDDDGKPTAEALSWAKFPGTIPYAPVETLMGLLPGKIREARHDLESFFYILLWFSLRYAGPKGLKRTDMDVEREGQMQHWIEGGNRGDMQELGEAKYTTMTTTRAHFRRVVTGNCTPYFKDLVPCIEELWLKFFPKETSLSDEEDVRPEVTHEEVIDILRKPLEWLPEVDETNPDTKVVESKEAVAAVGPASAPQLPKRKKLQEDEHEDECPRAKRARIEDVEV